MTRLCCSCAREDHICTRSFSCPCVICRREKPKSKGQEFKSFQIEGDFLIEDVMA